LNRKKATPVSICEWSRKTFPNATPSGRRNKFLEECREYGLAPDLLDFRAWSIRYSEFDDAELPDIFVTLVQVMEDKFGPWDTPGGAQDVMDALLFKLENREWSIRPDGTGQHSKEAPDGIPGIADEADSS